MEGVNLGGRGRGGGGASHCVSLSAKNTLRPVVCGEINSASRHVLSVSYCT